MRGKQEVTKQAPELSVDPVVKGRPKTLDEVLIML